MRKERRAIRRAYGGSVALSPTTEPMSLGLFFSLKSIEKREYINEK
jgi:hypothetical protein